MKPGEAPTDHPIRAALLALLRERDTLTATQAARELGYNSGLCSFHLRQLARHGYVEDAGGQHGRARPWRLARVGPGERGGLGELARELEDEGYRRWLRDRHTAPPEWAVEDSFSAVVYLRPDELRTVGAGIRAVLHRYATREHDPATRPADARPVAAIARLFSLLPTDAAQDSPDAGNPTDREEPGWRSES